MALTRDQQIAALEKAGLDIFEMDRLKKAIKANPAVKGLLDETSEGNLLAPEAESALLTGLGAAWKANPGILKQMDDDLKNPEQAAQIKGAILKNPAGFASTLPQYKGGNVPGFLASIPDAPAPAPTGTEAPTPAPAPAADAPAPKPEDPDAKLKFLAKASNKQITGIIDSETVLEIAKGLSKAAKEKFGINTPAANAFVQRIDNDKTLQNLIIANFKRNPGFIREMAKMALDRSPLKEPALSPAKTEMNKIIANPWNLANDAYTKNLEQKMKMASAVKKGDYSQLFSGFGDKFALFGEQIKSIMSGFQGLPVLSMGQSGSLFPTVMVNLGNFYENQDRAFAASRYSPRDMTAYAQAGKDGFYTHQVPVMDKATGKQMVGADGKPLTKEVPNTLVEIQMTNGKKIEVIPSIGQLRAMQERGSYDPDGKWIPGNIQVAVVTHINKEGMSTQIENVMMTPAEFEKYKRAAEQAAGNGRTYPVATYTEADESNRKADESNRKAEMEQHTFRVDVTTGAVTGAVGPTAKDDPNYFKKRVADTNEPHFLQQA